MHDENKEFVFLFVLVFVLGLALGVIIGSLACSTGDTDSLVVNVEEDGSNVKDANVTINGESKITKGNGQVVFGDLPFGTYDIDVTANGYEDETVSDFEYNESNQEITINLTNDGTSSKLVEQP